jgi:xanthine dehydrogenase YagR molybdenum-binding subunit
MTTSPVGQDVDRVDGRLKVTGGARFAADQRVAGAAHAQLVLSTIARGQLRSMDTEDARRAPGVVAVYTPFAPLPLHPFPDGLGDRHMPLQDTAIRYWGQIIGMVVAETVEQARDAAMLIRTTCAEERPRTSLAAGLPGTSTPEPALTVLAPGVGSIEDALRASAVVVESTVTQPAEHHAAMEPHATTAVWHDGRLTVHCGTQVPASHAAAIAAHLGVDVSQVRVLSPHVGGGFGGKTPTWGDAVLCAAAARAIDRPVTLVLSREQVFSVGGHRPAIRQTVRLGAGQDGVLTAVSHHSAAVCSAAGGWVTLPAADTSAVLYATPNLAVDHRVVTLDVPPTCAMRAPHEAPGAFALETAMDELAVAVGIDPVELRLRNYATETPGRRAPWSSKHLDECYRVGAARFGWAGRDAEPRARVDGEWLVGTGMATAIYPAGRTSASVRVCFRADGTATVASGTADLGTGATTMLAILGADALGLPVSRVEPRLGDSALPPGAPAAGSVATGSTAPAVRMAARAAIKALVQLAVDSPRSPFRGMNPAAVRYRGGQVRADGEAIAFADLLTTTRIDAVEASDTAAPGEERGRYAFHSFGAHFCEVRVNRFTGEPRVSRFATVVDVGRVVNAKAARGQVVGGVIFGIGHALLEANPVEESGRLASNNLGDYLVPVNADIPDIDVHFLDHPDTVHNSFGARGVGELGTVGSAAAIGNAVYHATGIRVRGLPITLDALLG